MRRLGLLAVCLLLQAMPAWAQQPRFESGDVEKLVARSEEKLAHLDPPRRVSLEEWAEFLQPIIEAKLNNEPQKLRNELRQKVNKNEWERAAGIVEKEVIAPIMRRLENGLSAAPIVFSATFTDDDFKRIKGWANSDGNIFSGGGLMTEEESINATLNMQAYHILDLALLGWPDSFQFARQLLQRLNQRLVSENLTPIAVPECRERWCQ